MDLLGNCKVLSRRGGSTAHSRLQRWGRLHIWSLWQGSLVPPPSPPLPSAAPVGPGPAPGNCLADQNCHPHFIILGPGKLLFMTVNLKMK